MPKISPPVVAFSFFSFWLILGFWLLVLPQLKDLGDQKQKLLAYKAALNPQSQSQQNLLIQQGKMDLERAQAKALLPASDLQYDLTVQIDALAKQLGITLTAFSVTGAIGPNAPKTTTPTSAGSPAAGATPAGPAKVAISLSFKGSYSDAQRVIAGLVSLDRFIQVEQANIGGSTSSESGSGAGATPVPQDPNALSIQINASAYYLTSSSSLPAK